MIKTNYLILLMTVCIFQSCILKPVSYGNNPHAGHYAAINGINLYYETYGKGKTLLMLHGNGGSIEAFRYQIPFFEKYFRVIAVDSRLHGKSGGNADTLSYEMMAADFAGLLDYLKVDSAFVLGWSDGGIDGLLLAKNFPKKVSKLAISGANTLPDSTAISNDDLQNIRKIMLDTTQSVKTRTLNRMMIYQPQIPFTELAKIACPVLVMAGDKDMIKAEHTLKIYQSLPNASLCIFPDSYHHVCQQHPDLFNETVLTFFGKQISGL